MYTIQHMYISGIYYIFMVMSFGSLVMCNTMHGNNGNVFRKFSNLQYIVTLKVLISWELDLLGMLFLHLWGSLLDLITHNQ